MDSDSDVCMESEFSEEDFFDSEEEEENIVVPAPKRGKKAAAPKESTKAAVKSPPVLSSSGSAANITKPKNGKTKTVEEMYQKKTQLEHILLRPDTYIGSVVSRTEAMFVLQGDRIVEREITYTPGLFKIFDEILVNAADNKQRNPDMDKIDITIDAEENLISIKNNGKGIPIVIHKEHNIHVPSLIFGHLLTGSNFDDNEKKTTGGRNGFGAKLANVFSMEFTVECVDVENGLKFQQTFRNNMTEKDDPIVKACKKSEMKAGDYVKISFSPDLHRFGMKELNRDTVCLLSKRAYDIAGTMAQSNGKRLSVTLNGKVLPIKSFKDYLELFDGMDPPVAYIKTDRWEVGVSASKEATMKQISFVNAICTSKGGGHVNYIADQVGNHLVKTIKKKNKGGAEVKPAQIKNHLAIFVNCMIDNPAFDSQTKECMTTRPKAFGSECKLPEKFLKQLDKSEVVEVILAYTAFRDRQALKRKGGTKKNKLTGISKLDDANFAGTAKSKDCTLIITEGDSAKSLAMSGLSVVGRDYYGVFPLRGKPLNVRDAPVSTVLKNEEIKNLVDIMGLKFQTVYDQSNIKTLRYGHLMIMADQDTDGSHIKGLIINCIHHFWPSLLDVPDFLQQFITPIVKASKGKKSYTFFSLPEYQEWLESTGNNGKGWNIKYYKGLGTSTSAEAKEYFSNLDLHEVHFSRISTDKVTGSEDEELEDALPDAVTSGSDLIDMVFRKTRVEDRKQWLNSFSKDTYLDYANLTDDGVKYSDFINREYILFSKCDNERSIPHVMDGFKPSQRKVLFACFKRKLRGEIKVAQLTGYVAEHSAYHHGEQSLQGTIVNMAQNFVGSNNVNLLVPSGQFGTRRMGGKDSASARYIFTKLEPITRAIFHPDDDDLLTYKSEDGLSIEPEFYMPVIPMILVNGADGIGTGWSTLVHNYDPRDIIANLRRKIAGEEFEPMKPYYNGFTGEIAAKTATSFSVRGKIERLNDTTVQITELPIKKWTQDYKVFLEKMLAGDSSHPPDIKDIKENHTESTVSFTVTADKQKIDDFEKEKDGLYGVFKLTGSLATSNMTLFNQDTRIERYQSPEAIMSAFYELRLDYYGKRKDLLVQKLETEQKMLSNKARFVEEVCAGTLIVNNRKRKDLLAELQDKGFDAFPKESKNTGTEEESDSQGEDDVDESPSDAELAKGYEYLLGMKIWSLTYEKAEQLRAQLAEKTEELATLQATAPTEIWLSDLDAIEIALDQRDLATQAEAADERRAQKKNLKHKAKVAQKRGKKKKDEWDSDMESSDEDDPIDIDSDSEPDFVPKKTVARKKPTITKASIKPPASKKTATAGKAAPAKAAASVSVLEVPKPKEVKKPAKSPSPEKESDDDEIIGKSLLERMKSKLYVSPQVKKSVSRTSKKRPSPRMEDLTNDSDDESLNEFDAAKFNPVSVTPAKPKAAPAKRVAAKKPAAAAGTKKGAGGRGRKKQEKFLDSSESEDEFDFRSEEDEPPSKKVVPSRARSGRAAAKKVNYDFSDDDDESEFASSESD